MIEPFLDRLPLVAILRGVTPEEVVDVTSALVDEGFAIVEVPLNSPRPLESIGRLRAKLEEDPDDGERRERQKRDQPGQPEVGFHPAYPFIRSISSTWMVWRRR